MTREAVTEHLPSAARELNVVPSALARGQAARGGARRRTQTSGWSQAAIGIIYGVALHVVNFHVIARAAYPWFLDANQYMQLVMHALAYGLPLGLLYALAERRAHPIGRMAATTS
jgi:hypothetical protein